LHLELAVRRQLGLKADLLTVLVFHDDRLHDAFGVRAGPEPAAGIAILLPATTRGPGRVEDLLSLLDGPQLVKLVVFTPAAEIEERVVVARTAIIERAPVADKQGQDEAGQGGSPVSLFHGLAVEVALKEQRPRPDHDHDGQEQESEER